MSSKIKNSKLSLYKTQHDSFYKDMDSLVSCLNDGDRDKLDFARYFLCKMQLPDVDDARIQIEEMDVKTFQYLILSILMEYESYSWPPRKDRGFRAEINSNCTNGKNLIN